jgi:hypothetical protein
MQVASLLPVRSRDSDTCKGLVPQSSDVVPDRLCLHRCVSSATPRKTQDRPTWALSIAWTCIPRQRNPPCARRWTWQSLFGKILSAFATYCAFAAYCHPDARRIGDRTKFDDEDGSIAAGSPPDSLVYRSGIFLYASAPEFAPSSTFRLHPLLQIKVLHY